MDTTIVPTPRLDPTWVRALAGSAFRRADTQRDERGPEPGPALEASLRSLAGWWPPGRESRRGIARFNAAVLAQAAPLKTQDDAAVAQTLHRAMQALRRQGRALAHSASLAQVFACVAVASERRLGLWPHPVQLVGARLLLNGCLAEMQTGEGKTLVAALAATAMAASGAAVHVISTNDYLAQRDCEEMGPLFNFFGLQAGFIQGGMQAEPRRAAYARPICYVAGKEVVFDYLKDRLSGHASLPARVAQLRQAGAGATAAPAAAGLPLIPALHFAIVDEADSVLIDEARTPMILSREAPGLHEAALLHWAVESARRLRPGQHFRIDPQRQVDLLPGALDSLAPPPASVRAVWLAKPWQEQLLRQALMALHLFVRDQHYILAEGKVQIVDESTGRVMPDRSWEQGLHQLIEAKEGLAITLGRETMARMTFQRFLRRYYLLAGLTGTAAEAARELWSVYRLKVRRVPPNRPNQRRARASQVLDDSAAKWRAVATEAQAVAAAGQPVLVGTRSVQASEELAEELTRRGVPHTVLNARQDADEAQIVAAAGRAGCITVATNMAGRGTDIKLDEAARRAGGLHVILTEFHDSPRVDRQLLGRCGRQGDAGSTRAIVCLQDSVFKDCPAPLRAALAWLGRPLLQPAVRWAQARAERRALRTRLQTLRQDRELARLIGFAGPVT